MMVRTSWRRSKCVAGEVPGQRVQQRGVDGRVRGAEVVVGIDDAAAHQVAPDAVGLARAKNGLSGAATQSASACRRSASGAKSGVAAPRKSGRSVSLVRGWTPSPVRDRRRPARRRTRACRACRGGCSRRCGSRCGRRRRPGCGSRSASSARTGGCGTWRTASARRGTPGPWPPRRLNGSRRAR